MGLIDAPIVAIFMGAFAYDYRRLRIVRLRLRLRPLSYVAALERADPVRGVCTAVPVSEGAAVLWGVCTVSDKTKQLVAQQIIELVDALAEIRKAEKILLEPIRQADKKLCDAIWALRSEFELTGDWTDVQEAANQATLVIDRNE